MINKKEISKEQALNAIANREFDKDILMSTERVVVVMSQNWCPQWLLLKNWMYGIETEQEINVFELIYNKTDYFEEFKSFKENQWKNFEIPYLRFYKDGNLIKESNYINKEEFINSLTR